MTRLENNTRTLRGKGSLAKRFKVVRQASALFAVALLSLAAMPAEAQDCSDYPNGTFEIATL